MTTRREFIATMGAALGVTSIGCRTAFSALSGTETLQSIGIQLYTLRALTSKDLEGTLQKVAEIGYREVEFAGYFGRTPAQIKAMLAANRLTSPSTHIGLPANDDAWKKSVDDAKAIGHEWIVIPFLDPAQRGHTVDDWKRFAARLNDLARMAKTGGLRFAYHNHDFEFAPIGGTNGYEVLHANTDPALVEYEMDIYWVVKAGADPLDLIARYPRQFPLMHIKDASPLPEQKIMNVGAGTIDFAKIFAQQKTSGMQHAFVENDSPGPDPLAAAAISYRYLAKLTF